MAKKVAPEHEIDQRAETLLRSKLPSDWILRRERPDFGVDFSVEVTRRHESGASPEASGKLLYLQLRGTTTLSPPKAPTDPIRFRCRVVDLDYLQSRDLPSLLVVADVEASQLYWLYVHEYIQSVLDVESPGWRTQQTVTLRIDRQAGDDTAIEEAWPQIAQDGPRILSLAKSGLPDAELLKRSRGIDVSDEAALENERKRAANLKGGLDLEAAIQAMRRGDLQQYKAILAKADEQAREAGEPRLLTGVRKVQALMGNPAHKAGNRMVFEAALEGASFAKVADLDADRVHLEGIAAQAAAHRAIDAWGDLRFVIKMAEDGPAKSMVYPLRLQLPERAESIQQAMQAAGAAMNESLENGYFVALVDLMRRQALLQLHLLKTAELMEGEDALAHWRPVPSQIAGVALDLATRLGDVETIIIVLEDLAIIQRGTDSLEAALTTLDEAERLAKENELGGVLASLKRKRTALPRMYARPSEVEAPDPSKLSSEEIDKLYRDLISRMGIRLDDPDDEIAWIMRVGLRDRNPERALRWCEHLEIEVTSTGVPGQLAGLPTAGSKALFCEKVDELVEGLQLDDLLKWFQKGPCVGCQFRKPRADDWRWSPDWQISRGRSPAFKAFLAADRSGRSRRTTDSSGKRGPSSRDS